MQRTAEYMEPCESHSSGRRCSLKPFGQATEHAAAAMMLACLQDSVQASSLAALWAVGSRTIWSAGPECFI